MAARAQIQIAADALPADAPRVITDRTRLAQVLMNFGSNAIKYGKTEVCVILRLVLSHDSARILVIDDGVPSLLATGARRHTIVYVEDNPSNIAFVRDLVEELPSVELLIAPTAEIGLELIRTHLPRVVIMGINLPGINGFDAVARLREWPETRDIPVIGLSAAALAKDTARAKEAGFYRYLTKPVKVDELTQALETLLENN